MKINPGKTPKNSEKNNVQYKKGFSIKKMGERGENGMEWTCVVEKGFGGGG